MKPEELDGILCGDKSIEPSSDFTRLVMEAVRREAAMPRPIQFPWQRALPGLVACVVLIVVAGLTSGSSPEGQHLLPSEVKGILPSLSTMLAGAVHMGAGWITLAGLLTLASVAFSMRLTAWRN